MHSILNYLLILKFLKQLKLKTKLDRNNSDYAFEREKIIKCEENKIKKINSLIFVLSCKSLTTGFKEIPFPNSYNIFHLHRILLRDFLLCRIFVQSYEQIHSYFE